MSYDQYSDIELEQLAQTAAEERLDALWEFELEGGDINDAPYAAGPFCGCRTCEVREVLDAAYPFLAELARREPAPSHAVLSIVKETE